MCFQINYSRTPYTHFSVQPHNIPTCNLCTHNNTYIVLFAYIIALSSYAITLRANGIMMYDYRECGPNLWLYIICIIL